MTEGPRKAMTFASADVTDVDHLVSDPSIILEQKFDGTRSMCVVEVLESKPLMVAIEFLSRSGAALKHSAATQWIPQIEDELTLHVKSMLEMGLVKNGDTLVLDGEIMIDSGVYILFDLPHHTGEIGVDDHYFDRRRHLFNLFRLVDLPVTIGRMAETPEEKQALYDRVTAENGEGVMAKNRMSPFIEGKRVKHSLKVKFYKTADVVVISWHRGRDGKNAAGQPTGSETGKIHFGVHGPCPDCTFGWVAVETSNVPNRCECDGKPVLQPIGNCSIIGKPAVVNGDVIEVKYLYRGAGGALVQPTMIKVRYDRTPESCTYEQFAVYSKAVLG